jgi:integrase
VAAYPDIEAWFSAPLARRVGRLYGERQGRPTDELSYRARPYLVYLALAGHAWLDFEWLLGIQYLGSTMAAANLGIDLGLDGLHRDAVRLGYTGGAVRSQLHWGLVRIVLHRGDADVGSICEDDVAALEDAVQRFDRHPDVAKLHGSSGAFRCQAVQYLSQLHLLRVVLYHRGQLPSVPQKGYTSPRQRQAGPAKMEAVLVRYLAARTLTDRPATVKNAETGIRRFMAWAKLACPGLDSFAQVTRSLVLEYSASLAEEPSARTGRPLGVATRLKRLSDLSLFFPDVASWEWEDVPAHPLIGRGDLPKAPLAIPRYIAGDDLERLMAAVRQLECPYQRAALLVARWSGARRDEIRRLGLDCLDSYPDGTPRLRIPAGKTRRERMVPLHEEAARAVRELQARRQGEQGLVDPYTGNPVHYLFLRRGKLASHSTCSSPRFAPRAPRPASLALRAGRP